MRPNGCDSATKCAAVLEALRAAGKPLSIEGVARVLGVDRRHVEVPIMVLNVGGRIEALHPTTTRRSRRTHAVWQVVEVAS
jgi:pyrimidine operon attenuation protein/uracil phosphoribosyltransferase